MRQVDQLLADAQLVQLVYEVLARRWTHSLTRGRKGTPAEVVLRLLLLKHMRNWSYAVLEREVRANVVYRHFTRVGAGKVPDAKTLGKLGVALGPDVVEQIHGRVVAIAREHEIVQGRRMRVDTTVVETNIHYPTDGSLLGDGVRVLTRTMKKIEQLTGGRRETARSHEEHAALPGANRARQPQLPHRSGQAAAESVLRTAAGHHRPGSRPGQALRARGAKRHQGRHVRYDAGGHPSAPRLSPDNDPAGAAGHAPNQGAPVPGQHPCARQARQPVRAPHGDHPQGQGLQAHRVRQDGQDPGGRAADRHALRGLRRTAQRHRLAGPGDRRAPAAVRPAAAIGHRRRRLLLAAQRGRRARARRQARRDPQPRHQERRAPQAAQRSAGSAARRSGAPVARGASACSSAATA